MTDLNINVSLREWHHFYLGIVMCLLGFVVMALWSNVIGDFFFILGAVLMIDDYVQHRTGKESLLHRWYIRYLYSRYEWVRKFNNFMDGLFGG